MVLYIDNIPPNTDKKTVEKDADVQRIVKQNANVYRWNDIEASAKTLPMPTLIEEALNQICCQLGYLPKRQITIAHEPFIRIAILDYYIHNDIDRLFDECASHVKAICMKDLEPHKVKKYDAAVYQLYHSYLPEYGDNARARIIRFLGHEPHLDHSIKAEMIMREKMANDTIYLGDERTTADFEVLTIVEYREWLSR